MASEKQGYTIFERSADETQTRAERWRRLFDVWIRTPTEIMWKRRRTRIGLLIVSFYILMGTVGVVLISPPEILDGPTHLGPFQRWDFFLGTTNTGKGVFATIVHATPPMLKMILAGAIFSTGLATTVGTLSGYKRGTRLDQVLMTISDIGLTIPGLPLVMVLAIVIEPTNPYLIGVIVTINAWAGLARSIRSQVLAIRENSYIEAAQAMGISTRRIITFDVLPNIMPYVLIHFMKNSRNVIFSTVALYYLGILPFTTLNWGVMINRARKSGALQTLDLSYWLIIPMVTVSLLTLGLILLAQGMDHVFNPRARARNSKTISDEQAK
jgi:peptide/nickel transport system permease protein